VNHVGGEASPRPEGCYAWVKRDIAPVGRRENGIGLYRYRYAWSDEVYVGVMAQEVAEIAPNAVMCGADGYLRVDYGRLGLGLMTWDEWVVSRRERLPVLH
jgi:endosialidase-like protein